jgi:dephospho-CoA kinase
VTAEHLAVCHRYRVVSLSDVLREEARRRGLSPTRDVLIELGNELRRLRGPGVLAEIATSGLEPPHVIDSIRNPTEVAALRRRLPGFVLVAVTAPVALRFSRSLERAREGDPRDLAGFEARERRENSLDPAAQQLDATAALADHVLENAGTLGDLRAAVDALLRDRP